MSAWISADLPSRGSEGQAGRLEAGAQARLSGLAWSARGPYRTVT